MGFEVLCLGFLQPGVSSKPLFPFGVPSFMKISYVQEGGLFCPTSGAVLELLQGSGVFGSFRVQGSGV